MPRRLTTIERSTMQVVYDTIASMLAEDNRVWLPDVIRGLGMDNEPQTIWQAIRDLLSRGLLDMRFVEPSDKVSAADAPLLMPGPKVGAVSTKDDETRLMLGWVRLPIGAGPESCLIFREHPGPTPFPPLTCVDKLTAKDLESIRVGSKSKDPAKRKESTEEQIKARARAASCRIDLKSYDLIAINSSGGKDSQAMLIAVVRKCCELGIQDRVRVYHADLKSVEWAGAKEIAKLHADYCGVPFEARAQATHEDLLARVGQRGEWPSLGRQYCTAEFKRGVVNTMFTEATEQLWAKVEAQMEAQLRREMGGIAASRVLKGGKGKRVRVRTAFKKHMESTGRKVNLLDYRPRILNCIGVRAEESPARAKKPPLVQASTLHGTSAERLVDTWFPIFTWTRRQVWDVIAQSGMPHHWAYDLGMPRLSCVACVMGNESAIAIGAQYNPELMERYVAMEDDLRGRAPLICPDGYTMKPGCVLTDKAKREKDGRAKALDSDTCPLDYERAQVCVPTDEEMAAWQQGRRKEKPAVKPARTRQWRFGMNFSIRELFELMQRCADDPTNPDCDKIRKLEPEVDSGL